MKKDTYVPVKRCTWWSVLFAATFLLATGCSQQRHAVIAHTGTNIGLELGQNPANRMLQGKLGYNRAEVAIVPTNRAATAGPGTQGDGATDVADVVMELNFSNIFSGNNGIYQRLAVGRTAVSQAGAAFMFARDAQGDLEEKTAKELSALYSVTATDAAVRAEKYKFSQFYNKATDDQKAIIVDAVKSIGYHSWDAFSDGNPNEPTFENMIKLKKALDDKGIVIQ